jgi:hypothetical protein
MACAVHPEIPLTSIRGGGWSHRIAGQPASQLLSRTCLFRFWLCVTLVREDLSSRLGLVLVPILFRCKRRTRAIHIRASEVSFLFRRHHGRPGPSVRLS